MELVQAKTGPHSPLFEERRWSNLVDEIEANACTPFLGAGASAHHVPAGAELAAALADEFGYPLLQGRDDLIRVAQYLAVRHENGMFPKRQLAKFFDLDRVLTADELSWNANGSLYRLYSGRRLPNRDNLSHGPHGILAALPVSSYLTTNYDLLMSKALVARNRKPETDFCRWNRDLVAAFESPFDGGWRPSKTSPIVYHLHGHAHCADSIVATEDDYTDFIVNIGRDLATSPTGKGQKSILPIGVRSTMKNNTLLFVGYRVADTNLRVVLRTLRSSLEISNQKLHIAVQLRPEAGTSVLAEIEQWQQYLQDYYHWSLKITVFWGDVRTFTSELERRLANRNLL
jgi:hypothetical protein